jgi:hypothetical protein
MPAVWFWAILVSSISVAISLAIFLIYLVSFRRLKTKFSFALLLLSSAFFIQSCFTVYSYASFSLRFGAQLATPLLILSAIELLGLSTLLWIAKQ